MPRSIPPPLSLVLTYLRAARGWTQQDLAAAAGMASQEPNWRKAPRGAAPLRSMRKSLLPASANWGKLAMQEAEVVGPVLGACPTSGPPCAAITWK
jgi:hypothetical protein